LSRYPFVEIIFYENQDGICFLWDLRLWILTIQPLHSYTLACCRPIYLIFVEFQNIDNNASSPPKILFSSTSIVIILQSVWSLWLRFFLQIISIGWYKILQLEVEKYHFIFIIALHVNKYIFQAQYSPKLKILGVNPGRTIQFKMGQCHFLTFQISLFTELFTMKHFLEVDNEVILLSNGWIWY
jgi:hypothetical protein